MLPKFIKRLYYRHLNCSILDLPWQFRKFRWFIKRGRQGWAGYDLWSLDYYLARVIAGSVKELANTGNGYQCIGHNSMEKIDHTNCPEVYKNVLLSISDGFQVYVDKENCEDTISCNVWWWSKGGCSSHPKARYDKAWKLLEEHFGGLWD